jgi:mannitol-1-phosphate/altronate dehydrogenase
VLSSPRENSVNGPVDLTEKALAVLADQVTVPTYDRSALQSAVVHIGVGGFHRAHQLVYFDDLAERGISTQWGVVGVGLHSESMKDALEPQNYLFTVVAKDAEGDDARVVGVMHRYIFAPQESEVLLEVLSAPSTRLVTLTITAGGYPVDSESGAFNAEDAAVVADLEHPDRPEGVFGYLVEALHRRRNAGIAAFTVLSCDNMRHNGAAARTATLSLARLRDQNLAGWISENVSFPSSMVDRITPETTLDERDAIEDAFGVADRWPVITEPFSQWIIEDDFCNGRPPLDQVGVRFVDDVQPYELMKTRLLNGTHTALGYLAYLCGYRTTAETMADPVLASYVSGLLAEIDALLPGAPGINRAEYRQSLMQRLANPSIADLLSRLCRRGSTKVANYVLPSLRHALTEDRNRTMLMLALAGWFRYLQGVDEAGEKIDIQDAHKDRLQNLARRGGADPRGLLSCTDIFGNLGEHPPFVDELAGLLRDMDRDGVHAVVARVANNSAEPVSA